MKYPERYTEVGIRPPTGVLLYGPPGNGKTLLAKAVATETGANFISVRGPELVNKWVGETEKGIRQIFKKARQVSPCIIFFDEFDAIAHERGSGLDSTGTSEKIVNQLLTELDGIQPLKNVVVIAATNRPDLIDPALKRPGRFDKEILVKSPDEKGREAILAIHLRGMPIHKSVSVRELAKRTTGFSGADLANLTREAGLIVIQEKMILEDVATNLSEMAKLIDTDPDSKRIRDLANSTMQISDNIQDDAVREMILASVAGGAPALKISKINDLIAHVRTKLSQIKVQVTKENFEMVLNKMNASVPTEAVEAYADYKKSKSPEGFKPNYVR